MFNDEPEEFFEYLAEIPKNVNSTTSKYSVYHFVAKCSSKIDFFAKDFFGVCYRVMIRELQHRIEQGESQELAVDY